MKNYNVIWFDDEYASLLIIKEKAYLNDINLVGFTNAKEGINEIEKNISLYDAVIVDGVFFTNPNQSGSVISDNAFVEVARALDRLAHRKSLPWFILSGQMNFTKGENKFAESYKGNKVFDKTQDEDLENLWVQIKNEADQQPETQIRHKYASVFSLCNQDYLGLELATVLMDLLKEHENVVRSEVSESKLNSIRKVVESIFRLFNKIGVIPIDVINGKGAINNSSKFLAGISDSYDFSCPIAPPSIAFLFRNILDVTQDASHSGEDLKLNIDQFIKSQPTGYLYSSVLFQLLEVMVWTKAFVGTHQDFQKNSSKTTLKILQYEGEIEQDAKNNFYCGTYLLSFKLVEERFRIGERIQILDSKKNEDPKTHNSYQLFAKKFKRIS